jgi:hypothetical protein
MTETKSGPETTLDDNKFVAYTPHFTQLLKQESEKAECLSVLHSKCHARFNKFSVCINIPVILVSSMVGFLSSMNLFGGSNVLLGALSMFVAFLKTLDTYFDCTKRSEAHRLVGLRYDRIASFIRIQLSLEEAVRISPKDMLDIITNDMQNLKDSEPMIPPVVVNIFLAEHKSQNKMNATSLPAICEGLRPVTPYTPVGIVKDSFTQTATAAAAAAPQLVKLSIAPNPTA